MVSLHFLVGVLRFQSAGCFQPLGTDMRPLFRISSHKCHIQGEIRARYAGDNSTGGPGGLLLHNLMFYRDFSINKSYKSANW